MTATKCLELYLQERRRELRTESRRNIRPALESFTQWLVRHGRANLNDLTGRDLIEFKQWRRESSDVKRISLNGILATVRRFLRFAEQVNAVSPGLAEAVPMPNVADEDEISDVVPDDELVAAIVEYLRTYEYASRAHVEIELIREIGLRMGAIRAIDLPDLHLDEGAIRLRHRPEGPEVTGTPLKNGHHGQREVNLSPQLTDLLEDYLSDTRVDVVDQYDRQPLLTTTHGRVSKTTTRRDFYKVSRPCELGEDCPHDRDIDSCAATASGSASECPSSFSPHPLRRWAIMRQLDAGVSKDLLSDRVDVSVPVLEAHYDQRSEERKREHRRKTLSDALPEYQPATATAKRSTDRSPTEGGLQGAVIAPTPGQFDE